MSYPWQSLSPKDPFVIQQSCFITDIDRNVATFLYQPIIGSHAYSLYMTLLSEVNEPLFKSKEILHAELFSILGMGIPDFYQARIRLEGIGLLKTYLKEGSSKQYIYEPSPPVSSRQFFEDDLLRLLLLERVGERKLAELRKRFSIQKMEKDGLQEITQSFLSVYHFSTTAYQQQEFSSGKKIEKEGRLVNDAKGKPPVLDSRSFDFSFLNQLLQKDFFASDALTEELKHTITVLHTLYGMDEMEISQYLLQAVNLETGKVDSTELEKAVTGSARKTGKSARKLQDTVEMVKDQTQEEVTARQRGLQQAGYTADEVKLILMSERMTPFAFIRDIKDQKNGTVTENEKKLLKVLLDEHHMAPAVLNMLIYYMVVVQNNPTMKKALAETIANHWNQANVQLPEQAIEVSKQFVGEKIAGAEKRQENRSTAKYYGKNVVRKIEKLPDWAKGDQPATTEELLPDDVQQKLNERLKRFRDAGKAGDK